MVAPFRGQDRRRLRGPRGKYWCASSLHTSPERGGLGEAQLDSRHDFFRDVLRTRLRSGPLKDATIANFPRRSEARGHRFPFDFGAFLMIVGGVGGWGVWCVVPLFAEVVHDGRARQGERGSDQNELGGGPKDVLHITSLRVQSEKQRDKQREM